jgi:GH24 family phage-related lysozyme (muramidase)
MYLDTLGKATIAIGHLILPHERERYAEGVEITMEEVEELFDIDLNRAAAGADELIAEKIGHDLPQVDWEGAAFQMKDSRWHKQTKNRCEELASIVANYKE